jgi:pyruvate/2-oxoglutarate dehydrogenase complex dihydrolipoamide acyltransferase (E2) component
MYCAACMADKRIKHRAWSHPAHGCTMTYRVASLAHEKNTHICLMLLSTAHALPATSCTAYLASATCQLNRAFAAYQPRTLSLCRYGRSQGSSPAPPAEQAAAQDAAEQGSAAAAAPQRSTPRQLSPRQRGLRRMLLQGVSQGAVAGASPQQPRSQHAAVQAAGGTAAAATEVGMEPGAEASAHGVQAPQQPPPPPRVIAGGGQQRSPSGGHHSVPQAVSPFAALATQAFDEAQVAGDTASSV